MHIIIHSINKNGKYSFYTYILMPKDFMHMFMHSQCTHAFLKKINNSKNEKYYIHLCIHALISLLSRFILRPSWCNHGLNLTFFKNFIWNPLYTVKILTLLTNRKTTANKLLLKIFLEKIWNKITQKKSIIFLEKKGSQHIMITRNKYTLKIFEFSFVNILLWKFVNTLAFEILYIYQNFCTYVFFFGKKKPFLYTLSLNLF